MKSLAIGLAAVATGVACSATRGGYETASYRVVRTDGDYELREYPTLAIVQTPMRGADDSFMRLFRYIDGQNVATQKIAMTTPVFMTGGATNASMAFVMPKTMKVEEVPQPGNPKLAVSSIPAGQFAVMRFSGGRNTGNETNAVATLTAWLQREKLTSTGEPIFGYFDPPWTPPFMRRNEVMLRIGP
jgi:DNA gyrase inhibitor GyrI